MQKHFYNTKLPYGQFMANLKKITTVVRLSASRWNSSFSDWVHQLCTQAIWLFWKAKSCIVMPVRLTYQSHLVSSWESGKVTLTFCLASPRQYMTWFEVQQVYNVLYTVLYALNPHKMHLVKFKQAIKFKKSWIYWNMIYSKCAAPSATLLGRSMNNASPFGLLGSNMSPSEVVGKISFLFQ